MHLLTDSPDKLLIPFRLLVVRIVPVGLFLIGLSLISLIAVQLIIDDLLNILLTERTVTAVLHNLELNITQPAVLLESLLQAGNLFLRQGHADEIKAKGLA